MSTEMQKLHEKKTQDDMNKTADAALSSSLGNSRLLTLNLPCVPKCVCKTTLRILWTLYNTLTSRFEVWDCPENVITDT